MIRYVSAACAVFCLIASPAVLAQDAEPEARPHWAVAVHGGAGLMRGYRLEPDHEAAMRAALEQAAEAAAAIVREGGDSLNAVEAAIRILEDDRHFNAGRGAVFTAEGANELDASIMTGATRDAGAVAGVTRVKNPISLARAVMERSRHVMMAGAGAEAFAEENDIELVEPEYFATPERWDLLKMILEQEGRVPPEPPHKWGTVGAVVLDQSGTLAAGTSTGGMTGKLYGRVGDSPIIGAGTYADEACAVSATGHGEYFIRAGVARTICARAAFLGEDLQAAADTVLGPELLAMRPADALETVATGGVIFVSATGELGWSFTSAGMFRARIAADTPLEVAVYGPNDQVLPLLEEE